MESLADAGLAAAPQESLARILPRARQGSRYGVVVVPGKDPAGGLGDLLGKDLAKDRCLLVPI